MANTTENGGAGGAPGVSDLLLERYLADDLPAPKAQAVERAAADSPEIRSRLDDLRAQRDAFLAADPPQQFAHRVAVKLAHEAEHAPATSRRWWMWLAGPSAAAVAVLLIAITFTRTGGEAPTVDDLVGDSVTAEGEKTAPPPPAAAATPAAAELAPEQRAQLAPADDAAPGELEEVDAEEEGRGQLGGLGADGFESGGSSSAARPAKPTSSTRRKRERKGGKSGAKKPKSAPKASKPYSQPTRSASRSGGSSRGDASRRSRKADAPVKAAPKPKKKRSKSPPPPPRAPSTRAPAEAVPEPEPSPDAAAPRVADEAFEFGSAAGAGDYADDLGDADGVTSDRPAPVGSSSAKEMGREEPAVAPLKLTMQMQLRGATGKYRRVRDRGLLRPGDVVQMVVASNRTGHVMVVGVREDGAQILYSGRSSRPIAAGKTFIGQRVEVRGSGTERVFVLFGERAFDSRGLFPPGRGLPRRLNFTGTQETMQVRVEAVNAKPPVLIAPSAGSGPPPEAASEDAPSTATEEP